jgi:hypothetical protein
MPCVAFCNEDGKRLDLPVNWLATGLWHAALVPAGPTKCSETPCSARRTQQDGHGAEALLWRRRPGTSRVCAPPPGPHWRRMMPGPLRTRTAICSGHA